VIWICVLLRSVFSKTYTCWQRLVKWILQDICAFVVCFGRWSNLGNRSNAGLQMVVVEATEAQLSLW
jgi:hypothetical protein